MNPIAPTYYKMLYQICQEEGIELQFLSQNWVKRLEKSDQVRFIVGYKFGLNPQSVGLVLDDKYATFSVLHLAKLPIITHQLLYEPGNPASYARGYNTIASIREFFEQNHHEIVIKPNDGTCGQGVTKITRLDQLATVLPQIFPRSSSASLCPFYHIRHEYRFVLLDGIEKLSYMKSKSASAWQNLELGARLDSIPSDKHDSLLTLAKQAAQATGLRFGSVDLIETVDEELLILELNSGVMTVNYLNQHPEDYPKVKSMYREAIQKMFMHPVA